MAASKPKKQKKEKAPKVAGAKSRLPRKIMLILAGTLLLSGASGALAVYMKPELVFKKEDDAKAREIAGGECTLVRTLKISRSGHRWIRKHIKTDVADDAARVATGLRIAGLLAQQEKADLYQVVVMDTKAPDERAAVRGGVIGAQVLFAPDPGKVPGLDTPFRVEFRPGPANAVGIFKSEPVSLSMDDIRKAMTAIVEPKDCTDPAAEAAAAAAAAQGGGHTPSKGSAPHGDEDKNAGHGEAKGHEEAEGHGAPEGEEHATEKEDGHGEPASPDAGHSAAAPAEETGLLASITGMIFGSDAAAPSDHGADGAHEPDPADNTGLLSSVKAMIFGAGEQPADTTHESPDAMTPDHATETPADAAETHAPLSLVEDIPAQSHQPDEAAAQQDEHAAVDAAHSEPAHAAPAHAAPASGDHAKPAAH